MSKIFNKLKGSTLILSLALLTFASSTAWSLTDPFQPTVPQEDVGVVQRARTDRLNGRPEAAIAKLLPVIKKDPKYYSAYYGLALAYARIDKNHEAIEYLNDAKAIRDSEKIEDFSIYNTLGWLYLVNGQYKDAKTNLEQAASYESKNSRETNSRVFNNLGLLYLTTGDYAKAETAFKKAVSFGGASASSNLELLYAAEKKSKASSLADPKPKE